VATPPNPTTNRSDATLCFTLPQVQFDRLKKIHRIIGHHRSLNELGAEVVDEYIASHWPVAEQLTEQGPLAFRDIRDNTAQLLSLDRNGHLKRRPGQPKRLTAQNIVAIKHLHEREGLSLSQLARCFGTTYTLIKRELKAFKADAD
jgi:hypothetical protein